METTPTSLAGIAQLDAAVQRLLTLRTDYRQARQDPLVKQTLVEIDQAIEELQVTFEELSQGRDDLERLAGTVVQERRRRIELMESLTVACVFTDGRGTIQEANTSALLLLGGTVAGVGYDSLCDYAADRERCEALLARVASEPSVGAPFSLRARTGPPIVLNASVARVHNVHPPLWRWFLHRA